MYLGGIDLPEGEKLTNLLIWIFIGIFGIAVFKTLYSKKKKEDQEKKPPADDQQQKNNSA